MKPDTEILARKIAGEPILDDFLLVGGTALSIYTSITGSVRIWTLRQPSKPYPEMQFMIYLID